MNTKDRDQMVKETITKRKIWMKVR